MYRVYCDGNLLYDPNIESLNIFSPKLELELNKTGSFEFTMYPNHPYFNTLNKLSSITSVYHNDELIFRGRILNDSQGFYNEKQVSCEGELAFLCDSIQRPWDFMSGEKSTTVAELFTFFINNHNAQVNENHQFKVGNITVTDSNDYIVRSDSTYLNTWDSINQKLISTLGGYLWVRHEPDGNYIDYLADFSTISNQTIEFSKNLLDIGKTIKGEDVATAIIPIGAKGELETDTKLTIEGLDDEITDDICKTADYVYSRSAVDKYGWIFKMQEWNDVTETTNLLRKAKEYLTQTIALGVTIELTAFDLSATNSNINPFRLGRYIKILTNPHGLNTMFLVKKLSIDITSPQNNKLTVGSTYSTLTEQATSASQSNNGVTEKLAERIENVKADVQATLNVINVNENGNGIAFGKVSEKNAMEIAMDVDLTGELLQDSLHEPILLNDWVNHGDTYEKANFWKDKNNIVHITGVIKSGITAIDTPLFVLPVGYRPRAQEKFMIISNYKLCAVDIYPDGNVMIKSMADATWICLCGISYRAA